MVYRFMVYPSIDILGKPSDEITPAHTDAIIMKWLRAGNLNLKKAEVLFRQSQACRALYDLDSFADHGIEPKVGEHYGFASHLGFAKDGTPVTYCAIDQQIFSLGKEINEVTYIIDMEDFSWQKLARPCMVEMAFDLLRIMQDLYPEVWKNLLVVNAAFYFYQAYNLFKPILRKNLLENIYVVSKENTPDLLLRYIDGDVLPVFLGGRRVDSTGDPMCREFLKFGGSIPEEYYLSRLPPLLPSDPGVECVYIGKRSVYNHSLVVTTPNSRLHIELRTEGGSIATTCLFRDFGPEPNRLDIPPSDVYLDENKESHNVRLISPCVKLQLHISPADVYCNLPFAGIYIYRFDNTFNWISGRKLFFRFHILPPKSS
ncbi:CRAL-TRIO domain-containing protein [Caerostris extrusa]|uniref:CRAL-TRIO domain-containing protein n=1 Tax=Caerostris extrusa TaxID=172846 RepID=A0AAV4NXW2_CAEEX|nr:CRAL-TRIO domain-containing protein [Caerostris extrusa]